MSTRRARELRNNLTPHEVILWARLKRLRGHGYHFRRQAPFKGYYLDFVCFNHRLAVELDGSQHGEDMNAANDRFRDGVLERAGLQVLRFANIDVRMHTDAVVDRIMAALADRPATREGRVEVAASGSEPFDVAPP